MKILNVNALTQPKSFLNFFFILYFIFSQTLYFLSHNKYKSLTPTFSFYFFSFFPNFSTTHLCIFLIPPLLYFSHSSPLSSIFIFVCSFFVFSHLFCLTQTSKASLQFSLTLCSSSTTRHRQYHWVSQAHLNLLCEEKCIGKKCRRKM